MYDLIVVGAGPAGASAARTAAQLGLKTLLLEKDELPRNKLCGGGVTPKVLKSLDFALGAVMAVRRPLLERALFYAISACVPQ